MRRAVKFTVGAGFTSLFVCGIVLNEWGLITPGVWGVAWVSTWE